MKFMIAILTMFVSPLLLEAQTLRGKVIGENNAPLDFVNVVILNADSAFVAGTITAEDGSFLFENPGSKAKLVKLSSIGYTNIVSPIPPSGDFGTIAMQPESVMLGEVVVKSNRPVTAIKGDALVTNVAGSQLEHAGTANDVLTQVPMVLGRDGNFTVFGKGSPAIYLNGREVRDASELAQVNSADIQNIEVITNPGSKYDASVKSVIRIRTKRPQGDGFSGTLRTMGVAQHYFRNVNQANFKYRTGGFEAFANFGYMVGKFQSNARADMITNSTTRWEEMFTQNGSMRQHDFFGKVGLSYLFNENHSIGAYYFNGFTKQKSSHTGQSSVFANNDLYDRFILSRQAESNTHPSHYANLYYNGKVGQLGIDFNTDYLWRKSSNPVTTDEASDMQESSLISSLGVTHSRMFAEKLVLSYPVWKGSIELGEEYSASRFTSDYTTDAQLVNSANSRVDEKNIAGFLEIRQSFGHFNVGAGLRYEHVKFDYLENGQKNADQSKSYDNLFPSLFLSTMVKNVQLSLSYTHKTRRPGYSDLDGTVDYINRFTLESGNPYLKPEKIHSIELMGAWRQFFAQLSYTYKKDPIMHTTSPYGDNGEVKLISLDNYPKVQSLQAFIGSRFKVGIWEPKVNLGIVKQWLTIDYADGRKDLNNPVCLVQFQNAIHLPFDIWMNVDFQWMSEGNDMNTKQSSSSYVNAKLYKAFFNNSFSVTIEANDIFNKGERATTMLSRDVSIYRCSENLNRHFVLTLQYTFNSSRDRYRGRGAGENEKNRF